jgi:hypothetical protein
MADTALDEIGASAMKQWIAKVAEEIWTWMQIHHKSPDEARIGIANIIENRCHERDVKMAPTEAGWYVHIIPDGYLWPDGALHEKAREGNQFGYFETEEKAVACLEEYKKQHPGTVA